MKTYSVAGKIYAIERVALGQVGKFVLWVAYDVEVDGLLTRHGCIAAPEEADAHLVLLKILAREAGVLP
jgi:hypothetical protein